MYSNKKKTKRKKWLHFGYNCSLKYTKSLAMPEYDIVLKTSKEFKKKNNILSQINYYNYILSKT